MLTLSTHHRQTRNSRFRSITDPSELKLAKQKQLVLAQSEAFLVKINALHNKRSFKKSSQIASFSQFIFPGGLVRSTGRVFVSPLWFSTLEFLNSRYLLILTLVSFIL